MNSDLLVLAWTQFWQVTVLIVVVATMARTVARNRPHLAYALWLVVLVKCVMPPLWASPSGVFCWIQPAHEESASALTAEIGTTFEAPPATVNLLARGLLTAQRDDMPATIRSTSGVDWSERFLLVGLALWVSGAIFSLHLSVWRWQRCLRTARRDGKEASGELSESTQALASRLGQRRPVRVILTRGRLGPAVTGVFRPTLLIPEGMLNGKTSEEIEPILAHELIHIRRGDLWAGLLQTVVQALWWFHPMVRWAVRQAMAEAERCCDEAVLAELGCKPKQYARGLLDVLQYKTDWVPAPAFPGAGRVEATSTRLERIMRLGHGCRRRSPWWCWLVMVGAAVVVLPGGAFVVRSDEPGSLHPDATAGVAAGDLTLPGATSSSADDASEQEEPLKEEDPQAILRRYALADVVQQYRQDEGMEAARARQSLAWQVDAFLRSAAQQRGYTARPVVWSGDQLLVRASEQDHALVSQSLEAVRVYGMAQLTVSTRFVSAPPDTVNSLDIAWTVMPNDEGDENNPLGLDPAWDPALGIPYLDRPLPKLETVRRGRVRHVKHTPMRYAILDEEQSTLVLNQLQGHRGSCVIQAPKVTLFNGQSAFVSDISQTLFEETWLPAARESAMVQQPASRMIDEGTKLWIQPVLGENGSVWLDYEIIMSVIREVNEFQVAVAGRDEPTTVQLPVVESMQVDGANEIPPGTTLAIAGLVRPKPMQRSPEPAPSMLTRLSNSLFGGSANSQRSDSEEMALMLLIRVRQIVPSLPAEEADASQVGMISH